MISSKAISTFRKKLKLFLFILFLPLSLFASEARVAYIAESGSYSSMLEDALSLLSGEITAEKTIDAYWAEREKRAEIAREEEVSSLRVSENFTSLEALESAEEIERDELYSSIVSPSFSDEERAFLLSGDEDAFSYLMMREDLSILIAASLEEDGLMSNSSVLVNGEPVYENLFVSSDEESEFISLVSALLPFFKDENAVIVRVNVPGIVSVAIDGEVVSPVRSWVVLDRGEHDFRFTSPIYETADMRISVDDGIVIEPELVEKPGSPLFISTLPYDSEIYYQGMKLDSHFIDEADVPFQLTLVRDGFKTLTVQSRLPMTKIDLQLRPEWMDSVNTIEKAKDRFYTNLLSTMISFGCFVAAQSLSGIYTDAGLSPAVTLMAGVSVVGLVELIDSMFGYYQAARLGI